MTKARCEHGRPWFATCLTCEHVAVRTPDEQDLAVRAIAYVLEHQRYWERIIFWRKHPQLAQDITA